jgi:hypothetical protein
MTRLELRVTIERRELSVKWEDGDVSPHPGRTLASLQPAAPHVQATVEGRRQPAGYVTLAGAETIGSYENKRNRQAFGFFGATWPRVVPRPCFRSAGMGSACSRLYE